MSRLLCLLAVAGCGSSAALDPDATGDAAPDAAVPAGVSVVPLAGCSWSFTGTFIIGGAPFQLLVDTGSNVLAVAGAGCAECTAATHRYAPGPSATDLGTPLTATYDGGDISWSGEAFEDAVGVAGLSARVELGEITSEHNFLTTGQCGAPDGILGIAGSGPLSLMDALAAGGTHDVFALHECGPFGTLWLGGFDPATTTETPAFVPMLPATASYRVAVTDFAVAGTSIGLPSTTYGPAIVDSGGPNIFVPTAAYTAITTAIAANPMFHAAFGDATWFSTPNACTTPALTKTELDAQLPTLTVSIGSTAVEMKATDSYLMMYRNSNATQYCPALRSTTATSVDLGNSVIRSHLVIFDREQTRMGFAATAPCI